MRGGVAIGFRISVDHHASRRAAVLHLTSVHDSRDVRILNKECRSLVEARFGVTLIAPGTQEFEVGGVRVLPITPPLSRIDRMTRTAWRLYRAASHHPATVVHIHDPELLPAAFLLRLRGKKVIYDAHEDLPTQVLSKRWIPSPLRPPALFAATLLIRVSNLLLNAVVAATPQIATRFDPKKTVVVQNFPRSDAAELEPSPYQGREPIVTYVGAITEVRGIREMLDAIELVGRDRPVRLALAGSWQPKALRQELLRHRAWDQVDELGFIGQREISALLSRVRIGLVVLHPLPNYLESYPTKLFDYMLAGIPIVASDFPLWRSIINEAECGLLVDPRDIDSIAAAITRLLVNTAEAERMGRQGAAVAQRKYLWGTEATKLVDLYDRLERPTVQADAQVAAVVTASPNLKRITPPRRVCGRCIMDTTDPEIAFDSAGNCNHCTAALRRLHEQLPSPRERETALNRLVAKIRWEGRKSEYDCIIGVSGGIDSTTVAYKVKELGLRPLAVHFDNGWDSELAVDNIAKALTHLGIELHTHVVDWAEFRDLQLSFIRASVANAEAPTDHGISALLFKTAMQNDTRFILSGSNLSSEAIMPHAWGHFHQDLRQLKALHAMFGTVPLKTMPTMSLVDYFSAVVVRGIRQIPLLNYVDYRKEEWKVRLSEEIGWRDYGGKHYESVWTRFFQGTYLPRKFGYDKRLAHLSSLICSGQISRADALAEMERPPYVDQTLAENDFLYVTKKFGLTHAEMEALMSAPVRAASDYPSNTFLLRRLERIKNLFRNLATRA